MEMQISLIAGCMFGLEFVQDPDEGNVMVIDLAIVRFVFFFN